MTLISASGLSIASSFGMRWWRKRQIMCLVVGGFSLVHQPHFESTLAPWLVSCSRILQGQGTWGSLTGCALGEGWAGRYPKQESSCPAPPPNAKLASLCHILVWKSLETWYLFANSEDCLLTIFMKFIYSKKILETLSWNSFTMFVDGTRTPPC
jgi:hypothetical protein